MAHKNWCKRPCSDCKKPCSLDGTIPCSPDCGNLTEDGYILVKQCLSDGCEEIKYIFNMADATEQEILERYGDKIYLE